MFSRNTIDIERSALKSNGKGGEKEEERKRKEKEKALFFSEYVNAVAMRLW